VAGAVGDAEQSVTYADRSDDASQRMSKRTTHADALHQAGRRAEAETRFRDAEQMQAESQPDYPLLYSLPGFRYCDLLLAAPERAAWQRCSAGVSPAGSPGVPPGGSGGETPPELAAGTAALQDACRAVSKRAAQTLKYYERGNWASLLDIALDHLTLGRAALYAAILNRSAAFTPLQRRNGTAAPNDDERGSGVNAALQTARRELDAAVSGLRRSGDQDVLPRGLLTRARLRFLTGACTGPESAQADLDEAWEIAERGPMRLFLADTHLYRARLFGRRMPDTGGRYPWESPAADLAAAGKLIHSCGYHRRDEELADAKAALLSR
jgi:hypothetical protein